MKKLSLTIQKNINKDIMVGDIVKVIDGSALTLLDNPQEISCYLIYAYPEITGFNTLLNHCEAEVLEVGIDDQVHPFPIYNIAYLQDIIIEIGKAKFRINSSSVTKIN